MLLHVWRYLRTVSRAGECLARAGDGRNASSYLALALILLCCLTGKADAADSVGVVTGVSKQASVGGEAAAVGTVVRMNDALKTGSGARLQVSFRDKSELSLGENATVIVDRFVYDPEAGIGESALNATRGAFRFATGRISSMGQKRITVKTPVAALAVRGTDFWGGVIDGQYGVLLMSNSALSVKRRECEELLTKANYGVDLPLRRDDDDECPQGYEWPPDKIARALSQTAANVVTLNPGILAPFVAVVPFTDIVPDIPSTPISP